MVIILIIFAFLIYILIKLNKKHLDISNNAITMFVGTMGTGKTFNSVGIAIKRLNMNIFRWKIKKIIWKHIKRKEYPHQKPRLYSNIPIDHKQFTLLTREHLLCEHRIVEDSVCFIDEIGQIASQYDFKNPNVMYTLKMLFRLWGHFIGRDAKLILTDQSSQDVVNAIRRRMGTIYSLHNFKKIPILHWFGIVIGRSEITPVSVIEELYSVEKTDVDERDKHLIWTFSFGKKKYDSRCYRHLYDNVPFNDEELVGRPKELTINQVIDLTPTQEELKKYNIKNYTKYTFK